MSRLRAAGRRAATPSILRFEVLLLLITGSARAVCSFSTVAPTPCSSFSATAAAAVTVSPRPSFSPIASRAAEKSALGAPGRPRLLGVPPPPPRRPLRHHRPFSVLGAVGSGGGGGGGDDEEEIDEEILLRISLSFVSPVSAAGDGDDSVLDSVRSYVRSFPFAAVLPVQPLTYVPTDDGAGVNVTFLRKKTKEKGSVDGGIDFHIAWADSELIDDGEEEENDGSEGKRRRIEITARRNSKGQTVSKAFSEMLVVRAFAGGITGEDEGRRPPPGLLEAVQVESVFHRWMQS